MNDEKTRLHPKVFKVLGGLSGQRDEPLYLEATRCWAQAAAPKKAMPINERTLQVALGIGVFVALPTTEEARGNTAGACQRRHSMWWMEF